MTAAITMAARVASGRFLEQPGEEQQGDDGERGDGETGHTWLLAPAFTLTAVLARVPFNDHACGEPGADVGRADADQLAVRVDLEALPRGVVLGGSEPST